MQLAYRSPTYSLANVLCIVKIRNELIIDCMAEAARFVHIEPTINIVLFWV